MGYISKKVAAYGQFVLVSLYKVDFTSNIKRILYSYSIHKESCPIVIIYSLYSNGQGLLGNTIFNKLCGYLIQKSDF